MFDPVPEDRRLRAAVASVGAVLGVWLMGVFAATPQHDRIPDPRVVPIDGLQWLVLGTAALVVSTYLIHTLGRQSGGGDADVAGSAERSRSTPIETFRRQYATGEISENEFERRLEGLLEAEDVSRVDRPESSGSGVDASRSNAAPTSPSEVTEEGGY